MSQPSRPQARRPQKRRNHKFTVDPTQPLEERALLAPIVSTTIPGVTVSALTDFSNLVRIDPAGAGTDFASAAPHTSVSLLSPTTQFGGDMVRIEAGPGGDFGRGVYAISRGAPNAPSSDVNAVNRPGTIYRVDPATGRASVFFDLNTVIPQLPAVEPQAGNPPNDAANDRLAVASGLANWYDMTFDTEGYFDGKPSLFVSSVDETDPRKNAIYRIAPDGTFMGLFTQFIEGINENNLTINPSAILTPPPEQQAFLRGLIAGDASSNQTIPAGGLIGNLPRRGFQALYFDANAFRPGQRIDNKDILPVGVSVTSLGFGPQVALVSTNTDYAQPVYSVFTDFGTPNSPAGVGTVGFSGIEGLTGFSGNVFDLLIGPNTTYDFRDAIPAGGLNPDLFDGAATIYRRFQDAAFDKFGFFADGRDATLDKTYVGSLFVADLASGLTVDIPLNDPGDPFNIPTNFPGTISVPAIGDGVYRVQYITQPNPGDPAQIDIVGARIFYSPDPFSYRNNGAFGGRIVRVSPDGTVTLFAENFNTFDTQALAGAGAFGGSEILTIQFNPIYAADPTDVSVNPDLPFVSSPEPQLGPAGFYGQNLSITFSADGAILYAADNDGIWQFRTTNSLAGSSTGQLIGLDDLRSLGVPYDGRDSAVAVVDTGIDGRTPNFRGRVARGVSFFTNSPRGDLDHFLDDPAGHGTLIAGVIHQFVPEATLLPVNVTLPRQAIDNDPTSVHTTTPQTIFRGLQYLNRRQFVNDPIRPNKQDRIIAAALGFSTTETFDTEGTAFRVFPQITGPLKAQLSKMRRLGVAAIAPAGQAGTPVGVGEDGVGTNTGPGDVNGMGMPGIFNEVISVSGTLPVPYLSDEQSLPTDKTGLIAADTGYPVNLFVGGALAPSVAGFIDIDLNFVYADRFAGTVNRNYTTDFVAPVFDLPTFSRNFDLTAPEQIVTTAAGTSLSSAVVTGSYALVASALDYWNDLSQTGYTVDGYLTTPVGARSLDYGRNGLRDLRAYANPDGINAILQWTAVPAFDNADDLGALTPPPLLGGIPGRGPTGVDSLNPGFRNFSRIDVGNAIAAIEGTVALDYLIRNNVLQLIDANNNGLITAQEIQTFVDNATQVGMAEAGAMARMLGGTATNPDVNAPTLLGETLFGELPGARHALQRRFNFFDYAANGQRNGVISIEDFKRLAHNLLPPADSFRVIDRQRASANGYLVDPAAQRNWRDLQSLSPKYAFVPAAQVRRYANVSPAQLGVGRDGPSNTRPVFFLTGVRTATAGQQLPRATRGVRPMEMSGSATATAAAAATSTPTTPATAPAAATSAPTSAATPAAAESTPAPSDPSLGGERARLISSTLQSLAGKSLAERRQGILQLNNRLVLAGHAPFDPIQDNDNTPLKTVFGRDLGGLLDNLF